MRELVDSVTVLLSHRIADGGDAHNKISSFDFSSFMDFIRVHGHHNRGGSFECFEITTRIRILTGKKKEC